MWSFYIRSFRKLLAATIGLAAIASTAGMIAGDISSGRFSASRRVAMANLYGPWDRQFRETADGKGLFLKFDGFRQANSKLESELYFRAVYVLYPQPVVTSQSSEATGGVLTIRPIGPGAAVESSHRTGERSKHSR